MALVGQEDDAWVAPTGAGSQPSQTTFVKMTSTVLRDQIGKNLLTYVDDIVVRSKKREDHIKDL